MKSPDMEENLNPPKKTNTNLKIVGYNMLAMVAYTIICRVVGNDGSVIDLFLIGIHFFACVIAAIIERKSVWLLSAVLVLLLGCSSCVGVWSLG